MAKKRLLEVLWNITEKEIRKEVGQSYKDLGEGIYDTEIGEVRIMALPSGQFSIKVISGDLGGRLEIITGSEYRFDTAKIIYESGTSPGGNCEIAEIVKDIFDSFQPVSSV